MVEKGVALCLYDKIPNNKFNKIGKILCLLHFLSKTCINVTTMKHIL